MAFQELDWAQNIGKRTLGYSPRSVELLEHQREDPEKEKNTIKNL